LRQLCVYKVANETGKPWVWWDYVTDFQIRCPMKEKKYNKDCAESVIKSLGECFFLQVSIVERKAIFGRMRSYFLCMSLQESIAEKLTSVWETLMLTWTIQF